MTMLPQSADGLRPAKDFYDALLLRLYPEKPLELSRARQDTRTAAESQQWTARSFWLYKGVDSEDVRRKPHTLWERRFERYLTA